MTATLTPMTAQPHTNHAVPHTTWAGANTAATQLSSGAALLTLTAQLHGLPIPTVVNDRRDGITVIWETKTGRIRVFPIAGVPTSRFEVETTSYGIVQSQYFFSAAGAISQLALEDWGSAA